LKNVLTIAFFSFVFVHGLNSAVVAHPEVSFPEITQFDFIGPFAEISNLVNTLKAGRSYELIREAVKDYNPQIFTIAGFCTLLALVFAGSLKASNRKHKHLLDKIDFLESKVLKAQMNPHFIFNSLNSIQSLIANDNPSEAMTYVSKFSKLLRSVIENSNKGMVTLQNELTNLKFYIELESLRLNYNLNYSLDVNPELLQENEMIAPLIIQPIVENSLWHGLSSKPGNRELKIQVETENDFLRICVTDNGIGRKAARKNHRISPGIGLANTMRRISLMNESADKNFLLIDDLVDNDGTALGTRVTVLLKRSRLQKKAINEYMHQL
jgi:LytS/YehU family sensor histidine kinase